MCVEKGLIPSRLRLGWAEPCSQKSSQVRTPGGHRNKSGEALLGLAQDLPCLNVSLSPVNVSFLENHFRYLWSPSLGLCFPSTDNVIW